MKLIYYCQKILPEYLYLVRGDDSKDGENWYRFKQWFDSEEDAVEYATRQAKMKDVVVRDISITKYKQVEVKPFQKE